MKSFVRALLIAAALALAHQAHAATGAFLLIEADTGKVLQAENATYPWYPASLSKLMTTYVTLQAVRDGRITFDTLLTVSANAAAQQPSKMGFPVGTQVTVDNALKMLLVKSANDMAVVLAEGVSGSIDNFAAEMNQTSQRLGMTQSSWVNPNGLPDDRQITSARDLGILARALIHDFPEYDFYWHIPAIKFGKKIIRNFNTLIDRYPGADGMKTGFICASGFNLVATATRGNRRLIAVVLGAPSSPWRAAKAAALLEHGFNDTGLSWLRPSLGTVEALQPVNVDPPDLHEEMCGPHRKRPAAEQADDDEQAGMSGDSDGLRALMLSNQGSAIKPSALIANSVPVGPPVVVFTGPRNKAAAVVNSEPAAKPAAARKAGATASLPASTKTRSLAAHPSHSAKPGSHAPAKPAAKNGAKSATTTPAATKGAPTKPARPKPVSAIDAGATAKATPTTQ
jgi:D-alanyl-D-alanine carboxypeptidase